MKGKDHTFWSVILAGVYDIKNLKVKLHPGEESKYNSPWNIAVDFTVNMDFMPEEISAMLAEYEKDHQTGMDIDKISTQIYDYTSGYPYLVSRLCQIADGRLAGTGDFPDLQSVWTHRGIVEAELLLRKEPKGRRIFLMYLKPIINGTGNYYIEAQTRDMRRTDIIVDYRGEQFVIELKIWHGSEYHQRGEKQLFEYLDYYNADTGYLLSFHFNKNKKTGIQEISRHGKHIMEVVV